VRKPHAVEENTNRRREGIEQKSVMQAMLGCAALGELRLAVPGMGYVGLVWGYERK
jgi:hypothetical protein